MTQLCGGYPVEWFVSKPSPIFNCGICLDVLNNPHQCQNGHNFCYNCINHVLAVHKHCPVCKIVLKQSSLCSNRLVKSLIDEMKVRCTNNNCDWTGSPSEMDTHKETCLFEERPIDCPLHIVHMCTSNKCCGKKERSKLLNQIVQENSPEKLGLCVQVLSETVISQTKEIQLLRQLLFDNVDRTTWVCADGLKHELVGVLKNNQQEEGFGVSRREDKPEDYFAGEFKNGMRNGFGVEHTAGTIYRGNWVNSKKEGHGAMEWLHPKSNKHCFYIGGWKNNSRNGYGMLIDSDHHTYTGYFKNGSYDGRGSILFANGSVLTGEFENHVNVGEGTLTFTNGFTFVGEITPKSLNYVRGTYTDKSTQTVFEGEFVNSSAGRSTVCGSGVVRYKNGSVYTGEFRKSMRHGAGSLAEVGGQCCTGTWHNDELDMRSPVRLVNIRWNTSASLTSSVDSTAATSVSS